MAITRIRLGDQIEDVTAKVGGIAIGRVEYLDGSKAWLMQPPYDDNGRRIPVVEVQDAYVKYVGEGVHVEATQSAGFHIRAQNMELDHGPKT